MLCLIIASNLITEFFTFTSYGVNQVQLKRNLLYTVVTKAVRQRWLRLFRKLNFDLKVDWLIAGGALSKDQIR